MELISKMQRVVQDLEAIEAELFGGSASTAHLVDSELSETLRLTVDRVRRLLWCHVTSRAKNQGTTMLDSTKTEMIERYRLERAVSLYREHTRSTESSGFIERTDRMVTRNLISASRSQ